MEVVLYNELGLEIAREAITENCSISDIIKDWVINAGDYIKFVE